MVSRREGRAHWGFLVALWPRGAGSHVQMQQMSTCRWCFNADIDVEWYQAWTLFSLMRSQQGNLETVSVDHCCRGVPMPLPKVQREGEWPWGVCATQQERQRVTKLSLTIQVVLYKELMQHPLISSILTLHRLRRSYFRSWILGLISINDTGLLLTSNLSLWSEWKQGQVAGQLLLLDHCACHDKLAP